MFIIIFGFAGWAGGVLIMLVIHALEFACWLVPTLWRSLRGPL